MIMQKEDTPKKEMPCTSTFAEAEAEAEAEVEVEVEAKVEVKAEAKAEAEGSHVPRFRKNQKKSGKSKLAILPPKIAKGLYPCRIGTCAVNLRYKNFNIHLRNDHKDVFYEFRAKGTTFTKEWSVNYNDNQDHDFIFYIKEMGLFFLNIRIHEKGYLTAWVQIINSIAISKRFKYTIETGNGPHHVSYVGLVKSCRVKRKSLTKDCLYVRENTLKQIVENKNLHFNLTIKRKISNRKIVEEGLGETMKS